MSNGFDGSGNIGNQSGKSGGDVASESLSDSGAGMGAGSGTAWVQIADPVGMGLGTGGDALSGADTMQMGGDVTDNTSMGNINISS